MSSRGASREALVRAVMAEVDRPQLIDTVRGLVDIASPTGGERALAEWIAARLEDAGLTAFAQTIDDHQANAVGLLEGPPAGPSLLLYAPIDTFTTGDPELDLPWAGPRMRPDMYPRSRVHGDLVEGLGAGNPKGHAAAVLVALSALARSGVVPAGDVVGGFGAGGMPSFAVDGPGVPGRMNTGHGVGAAFLLERGFTCDHAVIAKPGWNVSHEEVGLVWIDVDVPGTHTYVGSRHRLPYRNAVATAGVVATRLEAWFEKYAADHERGTMRPQGIVSSVSGGFGRLAAATSALVRLRLDVRTTPEQSAPEVVREVRAVLDEIAREVDVPLVARQVAAVPGTRTDPESLIVRLARESWEAVAGRPHELIRENSGATDANILRLRGVPTARVGMPKVAHAPDGGPVDFTSGMNLVDVNDMHRLVEILIRTVLALGSGSELEGSADHGEPGPVVR